MNFLQQALSYIFTAANWGGPAGLTVRIAEHLQYTVVAVVVSVLIAVPIGMLIGHTGRGTFLVVTGVNALRALPTLGVLVALVHGVSALPASMIRVSITSASTKIAMMPAMIWSLLLA